MSYTRIDAGERWLVLVVGVVLDQSTALDRAADVALPTPTPTTNTRFSRITSSPLNRHCFQPHHPVMIGFLLWLLLFVFCSAAGAARAGALPVDLADLAALPPARIRRRGRVQLPACATDVAGAGAARSEPLSNSGFRSCLIRQRHRQTETRFNGHRVSIAPLSARMHRGRQPEGRRRQDHHRGQPGRRAGRGAAQACCWSTSIRRATPPWAAGVDKRDCEADRLRSAAGRMPTRSAIVQDRAKASTCCPATST